MIEFTLSFEGADSDDHRIDFYDVAQALIGFQRSLAITTNLVLNGDVITQAPSLKGAEIFALPPEEGSWKITAGIVVTAATTIYALGTAPKDTPLGHLVYSAYDYVVSETLGDHVNFEKPLYQQFEENCKNYLDGKVPLKQSQLDSIVEKCEVALKDVHRPLAKTKSATVAKIVYGSGDDRSPLKTDFSFETYEYLNVTNLDDMISTYKGRVSSYNINTFKGRIYLHEFKRPIPFELAKEAKTYSNGNILAQSLLATLETRFHGGDVTITGFKQLSKNGHLKGILITDVTKG